MRLRMTGCKGPGTWWAFLGVDGQQIPPHSLRSLVGMTEFVRAWTIALVNYRNPSHTVILHTLILGAHLRSGSLQVACGFDAACKLHRSLRLRSGQGSEARKMRFRMTGCKGPGTWWAFLGVGGQQIPPCSLRSRVGMTKGLA